MRRGWRDAMTLDLFEVPQPVAPLPASMDFSREVAHLVGEVIKDAEGDRYELASRMSRLTGKDISKYMLDAWSAESRDAYNLPFYLVAVLEAASESYALSNWLADKRGAKLLVGREALNAELGKFERLKQETNKRIRELKKVMVEAG